MGIDRVVMFLYIGSHLEYIQYAKTRSPNFLFMANECLILEL